MIQRIQSVWLFLAALCNTGLLAFDLYHVTLVNNGVETVTSLKVTDHYPSLLIALTIIALPLFTIFMFKNRKRQRAMTLVSIFGCISFLTMMMMRTNKLNETVTGQGTVTMSYWIGAVLPVIAMIFLFMAIRGINKDEKLVKSLDRLR
jgi:peptidoglycan/LPS O-acetylase OafA/YrhL